MNSDSKKNRYNLRNKKKEKECKQHSGNGDKGNDPDEDDDEMNTLEYQKFLSKIFPSKFLSDKTNEEEYVPYNRCSLKQLQGELKLRNIKGKKLDTKKKMIKALEKYDKEHEEEAEEDSDYEDEEEEEEDAEEDEDEEEEDEEDEDEEEDDEEEEENEMGNFNIVFTIGAPVEEETEDEEEEEDEDESEIEIDVEDEEEGEDDEEKSAAKTLVNMGKTKNQEQKKNSKNTKQKMKISKTEYFKNEMDVVDKFSEMANALLKENKNSKTAKELLEFNSKKKKYITNLQKKGEKKAREKNMTKFKKAVKERGDANELSFFKKLSVENQKEIIEKTNLLNQLIKSDKPYRIQLIESDIPDNYKACALKKISALRYIEPGGGEFYKMKNWVDMFMRIPFNKYESIPMSIDQGIDKCGEYMMESKQILDNAVYGMEDAKMQILQMIGQWISNPDATGTAIALMGPPGTGKTTLVKEGISKILRRPFAFLALGGATDSSFLEGHGYTYEGSNPGKIVDILIQSKCMNPVIYFDEVDKISDTPKGEEITGILTHLTDTTQNDKFQDRYFAELEFNLSKCLFIFSYNDDSKVNPILKDRMYKITTNAYNAKEKTVIAKKHLLPKIKQQVNFKDDEVVIPDEEINYIIEKYTGKESGVRNLKRCLEIIYTKLNLYRLMKDGASIFEEKDKIEVTFPITVTKEIIEKLLKGPDEGNKFMQTMYL